MPDQISSYWALLGPEFEKINIYESPDKFEVSIIGIWRPIVLLYATHMCSSEVHNGGFLQLFWNSTGIIVPEAIEGFTLMGMPKAASLIEKTSRLLGNPYPRDRDERWDALLGASRHTSQELKSIFKKHNEFYQCFLEVTKPLNFDTLDGEFWKLAAEENGGFNNAADLYAQSVSRTQ
jgi:Domain of unknown function (DUF4375)